MPAKLPGYDIHFFGPHGMAEGIVNKSNTVGVDGVVHQITYRELLLLDQNEKEYVRTYGRARLYNGTNIYATFYTRPIEEQERTRSTDMPPSARYIDVIVEGCRRFNVSTAYIDYLHSIPARPRHQPKDFKKAPAPTKGMPVFDIYNISKYDGLNGHPLYLTINGKVRQYTGDLEPLKDPQH